MNANYTTNKILIDWLSFTDFTTNNAEDVIAYLGLDDVNFIQCDGNKGYLYKYTFSGININFGGKDSVWVEMSGAGCRAFEDFSKLLGDGIGDKWYTLLSYLLLVGYERGTNKAIFRSRDEITFNRIDIAYDDFNYLIDLDLIVCNCLKRNIVSKFGDKRNKNNGGYGLITQNVGESFIGINVMFGTRKSDTYMRCYDKAVERERQDEISHWVRWEIVLKRDRAYEFIKLLITDNKTIDILFFLVLNNYIRFVDLENCKDSNKSRAKMFDWWEKFAFSVTSDKVSLWVSPGGIYNFKKLKNYVENMAGGAIFTYCRCFGVDDLFDNVAYHENKLNVKYRVLLAEYTEKLKNKGDSE